MSLVIDQLCKCTVFVKATVRALGKQLTKQEIILANGTAACRCVL